MPEPKRYFVTISTMTPETGANAFGHTFVTFSKQAEGGRVEVTDAFGYYADPPGTPHSNKLLKFFKKFTGLDINCTGGYGHIQREEVRYLHNAPLPGVTYLISQEAYLKVKKELSAQLVLEKEVLAEIEGRLKAKKVAPIIFKGRPKFLSDQILAEENALAKEKGREPRLSMFEIRLDIDHSGWLPMPTLSRSHNCRVGAMELLALAGVPQSELDSLGLGTSAGAIPLVPVIRHFCYGGETQEILFYSQGEATGYTSKRTGQTYYNRCWSMDKKPFGQSHSSTLFKGADKDESVRLFFSIPPQKVVKSDSVTEGEVRNVRADYDIDKKPLKKMLTLLSNLQKIEYLILNADPITSTPGAKPLLLETLRHYYQSAFCRYKKHKKDARYIETTRLKGEALLENIRAGFSPYDALLSIEIEGQSIKFVFNDKTNELLCDFFDVNSDPLDDLRL